MKLTVITGPKGKLVALVHAHLSEHDRDRSAGRGPHATLRPRPGQKFHEIELPEECAKLRAADLRRRALAQVARKR
jgi:hypothetical protein